MHFIAKTREASCDDPTLGLRNVGFDIKASSYQANEYTLTLKGFLAPGWSGRLTAGLAGHKIGIVTGEAEKITTVAWNSTFKLKAGFSATDPLTIDYAALSMIEPHQDRHTAKIELREFFVEPCARHQGSLYIQIRGVDRLGFLGDLLDYFSMRCLFPVQMSIETHAESAVDKFWLKGVGGTTPSDSLTRAIREHLETLVISHA